MARVRRPSRIESGYDWCRKRVRPKFQTSNRDMVSARFGSPRQGIAADESIQQMVEFVHENSCDTTAPTAAERRHRGSGLVRRGHVHGQCCPGSRAEKRRIRDVCAFLFPLPVSLETAQRARARAVYDLRLRTV